MPEAEKHLRKATEIYPNYAAGWVMLGQILETRQQSAGAREACSRASGSDSNHLPAYFCSAEVAGRELRWHEVLNLTSRALELDPSNDAYAHFFSAIAYFNLNQLPEAKQRASKAEEIDKEHDQTLLQFLLAQIYEAKHDSTAAAVHFRECRKLAQDLSNLKKELSKIQSRLTTPTFCPRPARTTPPLLQVRDDSQFAVSCAVHCGPPLGSAMEDAYCGDVLPSDLKAYRQSFLLRSAISRRKLGNSCAYPDLGSTDWASVTKGDQQVADVVTSSKASRRKWGRRLR